MPEPSGASFLWVNKDVSNFTAENPETGVKSHVQKQQYRRRFHLHDAKLRSSTGDRASVSHLSKRVGTHSGTSQGKVKHDARGQKPSDETRRSKILSPQSKERKDLEQAVTLWTPGPFTLVNKGDSDPFDVSAAPIDPPTKDLLNRLLDFVVPPLWKSQLRFKRHLRTDTFYLAAIRRSIGDSTELNGLLALSAAWETLIDPQRGHSQTLSHISQSMKGLRDRVAQHGFGSSSFHVTYWLVLAEMASMNLPAALTHAKALRNIINLGGGLSSLGPRELEHILFADVRLALQSLNKPGMSFVDWDPGELPLEWKVRILSLEQRWLIMPEIGLDDEEDGQTLLELDKITWAIWVDLFEVHAVDDLLDKEPTSSSPEILRWVRLRALSCESRLLNHYVDLVSSTHASPLASQTSQPIQIAAAVCFATILWSYLLLGRAIFPVIGLRLQQHLRFLVEGCGNESKGRLWASRVLLWLLFVGALSEETALRNTGDWFSVRFARMATEDFRSKTWQQVRRILSRFLYVDRLQRPALIALVAKFPTLLGKQEMPTGGRSGASDSARRVLDEHSPLFGC